MLRCSSPAVASKLQSRAPDGLGLAMVPKTAAKPAEKKHEPCGCDGGGDFKLTPAMLVALGVVAGVIIVVALK